ncbi:MAG: type I 3-dehydroquinate dehydratase [Planctomycetota bacterium]
MLCVTGAEPTVGALAARLASARDGDLHEVRLDALTVWDESVLAVLAARPRALVVTCRPTRQGGAFAGAERERLELLRRAASAGVAYVDVEADVAPAARAALRTAAQQAGGQLLVSWHDFIGMPADLAARARAMAAGGDLIKLAVTVQDAAELTSLRTLATELDRPSLLIGMGVAGQLSRCRYPAFGAPWTYVGAGGATAPGQLSFADAELLGLPASAAAPWLCLLGGAQSAHSPGVPVYNRCFRARGLPWSYLLAVTERPADSLALLADLGVLGVSVTMPHKGAALAGAEPDALASALGACNTLRFDGEARRATNTDVAGVEQPLARALAAVAGATTVPRAALVLGAGGAAVAAVHACRALGLDVAVAARRQDEARRCLGDAGAVVAWEDRAAAAADVLINATSLGGVDSPWPVDVPLAKAIVFDLALAGVPSTLLARAAAEGARTIEPLAMWFAQGAAQMAWLTGAPIVEAELRAAAAQAGLVPRASG